MSYSKFKLLLGSFLSVFVSSTPTVSMEETSHLTNVFSGLNYKEILGFDKAIKKIDVSEAKIVVIEKSYNPDHSVFKDTKLIAVNSIENEEICPNVQKAWAHGNSMISLLIGQEGYYQNTSSLYPHYFPGGVLPNATVYGVKSLCPENEIALTKGEDYKVDALTAAFQQAFQTDARVINCSFGILSNQTPNGVEQTQQLLENLTRTLSTSLKETDKVIVFSAGNEIGRIDELTQLGYFKLFLSDPEIRDRLLIVGNLELISEEIHQAQAKALEQFQQMDNPIMLELLKPQIISCKKSAGHIHKIDKYVQLNSSSCMPGNLNENFVCAFGTNIVSASATSGTIMEKAVIGGTSQATIFVSSLCTLLDVYYTQNGNTFSAKEIVQKIKSTCIPLGDSEIFGHGMVNPWRLLDL